jgi:NifU-like protein involved in Fe-S cluster formation
LTDEETLNAPDAEELDRVFRGLQSYWMGAASGPFTEKALDLAYDPAHMGSMEDADAVGLAVDDCGDRLEVYLKAEGGRIGRASFLADGCAASMACGSATVQLALNRTTAEAHQITASAVGDFLGGLPESALHSAEDWVKALRDGLDKLERSGGERM